ncbi:MAG: transposase, partial [Actinobacteria bacterium]|nr:transposase [Actinomycetota bacterium]
DKAQLDAILDRHPTLRAAWELVQHFHAVYEADSPAAAMAALDAFADQYARGLVDFGPAIRTLLAWSAQVLAFHAHDRHTNAVAEGVNTKIELLERIAYGFRNLANLRARSLLTCPARVRDRLDTITGVGKRAAETIIAEIGVEMSRFPTAGSLASWAGIAPGNHITGDKRHSGKTTKGEVLAGRRPSQLGRRPCPRHLPLGPVLAPAPWIGKKKAAVAVGRSI